jgi:hypothetical protein
LVPDPLLVEQTWLELRCFAGGCIQGLSHDEQVSER